MQKLPWQYAFLLLILVSCGRPTGQYCTKPNFTATCYTLKKGGHFICDDANCLGGAQGAGTYSIVGDTLKFKFKQHQEIKRGSVQIVKKQALEKGIMLDLMVVDSQSRKPIIGYSAALYANGALLIGKAGNVEGKTNLETATDQKPVQVKISYAGHYPLTFELAASGNFAVTALLQNGAQTSIPEQERVYRLIKLDKDSMVLSDFEEGSWRQTFYKIAGKNKGR